MSTTQLVDSILQRIAEVARQKATRGAVTDDRRLGREVKKSLDDLAKIQQDLRGPRAGFSYGAPPRRAGLEAILQKSYPEGSLERRVQRWNDDVLLASVALRTQPVEVIKRVHDFREFLERELELASTEIEKALAASAPGAGLEWVPTVFSPELQDLIRLERNVLQTFRTFPMTASPMRLPQLLVDMVASVVTEATTNTAFQTFPVSDFVTANLLFEAKKILVASRVSEEFTEDSIVPVIPEIRRQVVLAISGGIEDAVINGSTVSPHPDAGVPAGSPQTAWNGLRAEAQGPAFDSLAATVDLSGALMNVDNILKMVGLMGRFGSRPGDRVFLTSPQGLVKLMGVQDTGGTQVLITADKFGPEFVLARGSLGRIFGSDVMVSDFVKTNLDANGVVPAPPAVGNTTILLLYNRQAFMWGDRRQLTVESERVIGTGQTLFVASVRGDFKRVQPGQTGDDRPVVIGRNISTI